MEVTISSLVPMLATETDIWWVVECMSELIIHMCMCACAVEGLLLVWWWRLLVVIAIVLWEGGKAF